MKNILYIVIAFLIGVTAYIMMSKPNSETEEIKSGIDSNQIAKKEDTHPKKQQISIKYIDKNINNEKQTVDKISQSKLEEKNKEEENEEQNIVTDKRERDSRNEAIKLPENYQDFTTIASSQVGESEVVIITDRVVKRNENTPPSVPFLITGKVNGESFTIALPATQRNSQNAIAYKDESGKVKVKDISPNELQSGVLNLGELDSQDNSNDNSNNSEQEEDESPKNLIPPMAPSI